MSQERRLNPAAMRPGQVAETLGVPGEWVEADLEASAPTNADGTVNLVHYAAWLNVQDQED
jgi:hypothetical protein